MTQSVEELAIKEFEKMSNLLSDPEKSANELTNLLNTEASVEKILLAMIIKEEIYVIEKIIKYTKLPILNFIIGHANKVKESFENECDDAKKLIHNKILAYEDRRLECENEIIDLSYELESLRYRNRYMHEYQIKNLERHIIMDENYISQLLDSISDFENEIDDLKFNLGTKENDLKYIISYIGREIKFLETFDDSDYSSDED
jgi:hypothetical protein